MTTVTEILDARIEERFADVLTRIPSTCGELTYELPPEKLIEIGIALRDEKPFKFEMLMDVCGVDYLEHGQVEWETNVATETGFSRGVNQAQDGGRLPGAGRRFAAVYHLMSIAQNHRLRLRVFCEDNAFPVLDSVTSVWNSADWYEREAFDLYGILFNGHADLRRLLTDYGFIGHPFRKDFPLIGNVEVRYDPEQGRVVYQPVSIEPRTLVPRVIRDDNRYDPSIKEDNGGA